MVTRVNRDISYVRNQAKTNIKKYIDELLPEEYALVHASVFHIISPLQYSRKEGSPSHGVSKWMEMDVTLALGKIRLIAVEDTVGDILIELSKS